MDFFLVDVKSITPSVPFEQVDKTQVEKLADSILECNGLLKPLVLQPTGPESYVVINGNKEYYAALQARAKDPRKAEMVNAFVIAPKTKGAISKQLEALNPGQTPSPDPDQSEITAIQATLSSQLTLMRQEMERLTQQVDKMCNKLGTLENKISEITKKRNNEPVPVDYKDMIVPELKVLAKKRNIKGRSYMNKAQLIDALKKSDMA
ncbi:MAG: hypothetical protein D3905_03370 [Candidatus Electrothrix sp. AS4_5]|nr:hypothetical protein [Candidatus Electrothrix gigas]